MKYQIVMSEGTRYYIYDTETGEWRVIVRWSKEAARAWVGIKNLCARLKAMDPTNPDLDRAEDVLLAELED